MRDYVSSALADLHALWRGRRHGARFWLICFVLAWLGAVLCGFPAFPVWSVIRQIPEPVWAVWAAVCVLLLIGPPRVRLWGATMSAVMFLVATACFTVATHFQPHTGTLLYGLLTIMSVDVAAGGAE